jgi:hypothetical protein
MESFTVSTLLTKEDYTKCLLRQTYKKPATIIVGLIGLAFVAFNIVLFTLFPSPGDAYPNPAPAIFGLFIIASPFLQVIIARKNTFKNPALQFPVEYNFTDDGLNIKGISFQASFAWMHIASVKEDNDFLLLFSNKTVAYFIKKNSLTNEQIDFIKSKVKRM